METYYQAPRSPGSPRKRFLGLSPRSTYRKLFWCTMALAWVTAMFTLDYRNEPFDNSPHVCYIPGSYSIASLQRCRPIFKPQFRPASVHAEYPKPFPRVVTVKKVVNAANASLPEVHRMVKDGFRFTAHPENLQTMLANNADLSTLVMRGEGAVRAVLNPLMFSELVPQERLKKIKKQHEDLLTNDALQSLLDLQSRTRRLVQDFTLVTSLQRNLFDRWGSEYENKLFKWKGTALGKVAETRNNLRDILGVFSSDTQEVNIYANTALASFQGLREYLVEIAHLKKPLRSSKKLRELSKKAYWKNQLLPFKYEYSIISFQKVVEDMATYYSDVQHTINFVSGVQATLNDLHSELHTFRNEIEHAPLFTTEKGGPAASLKFYGELFAEIEHDLEENGNKTAKLARERESAVQTVFVEVPFNLPKFDF